MRANVYFGGGGGSSFGLHLAGFQVVAFDIDWCWYCGDEYTDPCPRHEGVDHV